MEALFTIIGTIVGFVLSELATYIRNRRSDKRQAASVRTILSLEMQRNLQSLRDYWPKVNQGSKPEEDERTKKLSLARQIVSVPMPAFQRAALISQMPLLGAVLSEREATLTFQFYDRFSQLEIIGSDLVDALQEQQRGLHAAINPDGSGFSFLALRYSPPAPFDNKAPQAWDKFAQLIKQIFRDGNPLA